VIKDPDTSNKRKYSEVGFQFDQVLWTNILQDDVFNSICKPQVDHVLNGYNCCCFAYGQTGSGKTYSMFGEGNNEVRGMIPRSVEFLFQQLESKKSTHEVAMVCSFLEIYNDQIRDLGKAYLVAMGVEASGSSALYEKTSDIFQSLVGKRGNPYFAPAFHKGGADAGEIGVRPGLKEVQDEYQSMNYEIREDQEGNVFVKDLSLVPVTTLDEVTSLITMGLRVRATHETKMNANSSRSHTVFAVTVIQRDKSNGQAITGVLNLVDLAGSERLKKSESQGIRLKEALHINTSLTALGKVIMALDPASDSTHVPFRDSKLTRVLQNSLGGNSFTVVLAAIHPHPMYYEECLSTLQFANRCRNVRNNPRINYLEDNEDKDKKIKRLMEEIQSLRNKLAQLESGHHHHAHHASGPAVMTQLVSLLKKAGVAADISPDGGLVLNGQKISAGDLGLSEGSTSDFSAANDENAQGASGGSSGGKYNFSSGGGGGAGGSRMKKVIAELQEANRVQQQKLKEVKLQMEEQGRQLQDVSNELTKANTTIRHKDYEYKCLNEEKDRLLAEQFEQLREKHCNEIQQIIQNNKELSEQQATTMKNAPESFKIYSALIKKQSEAKEQFEIPLRNEFEQHLKVLETNRFEQMKVMKIQYEHWLTQKDNALEEFVNRFNAHRTKKAEQLRMCEKEIVRLYTYTEKLEEILDGVEKGQFRVQQKQGKSGKTTTGLLGSMNNKTGHGATAAGETIEEMGGVVLPKGLRPVNPLKLGDVDLHLTKKIVEKHKHREEKLEKIKEEAFQRSLVHAAKAGAATMGPIDPILQQQIRDLLVAPGDASNAARPHTTEPVSNTTKNNNSNSPENKGSVIESKDDSNIINNNYRVASIQFDDNNMSDNLIEVDRSEWMQLNNELNDLRLLKQQEQFTFEKISMELQSNETVLYLRHLENEIERQAKAIKDLGNHLQNSKIANKSLTRIAEKMATSGPNTIMKGMTNLHK
jgi:hypothetical protein